MPHSRPMPVLGPRCHELRLTDSRREWRVFYRLDDDAVIIGDVFAKTSQTTPLRVLEAVRDRFSRYDRDSEEEAPR